MQNEDMETIVRRAINNHACRIGVDPTERAIQQMVSWQVDGHHVEHERPSWAETYLSMAHTLAKRSHDAQTQHGCIIVSQEMKPLSWGYNGFLAGIWDEILPNTRPEKYPWMLHSEINAIMNATSSLQGGIVFLTGHPCTQCYQFMCASGISKIHYSTTKSVMVEGDDAEMARLDIIRWLTHDKVQLIPHAMD